MYARLIAKVYSTGEAENVRETLAARGIVVGVEYPGRVILTLTREPGLSPSLGLFHAADDGELQGFAAWASEAKVSVVLTVHPESCWGKVPEEVSLSSTDLSHLARGSADHARVILQPIQLAAYRNGEAARLRNYAQREVVRACRPSESGTFDRYTTEGLIDHLGRAVVSATQESERQAAEIVELRQQLAAVEQR